MSVENQWFVRMADGNVVTVSLDDLDAAFQNGTIDENTMVFRHGMKEWLPLSEAAGLDEPSADDTHQDSASLAPVAVAPRPMHTPDVYSVRPVAFDTNANGGYGSSTNAFDTDNDFEPQFKSSKKKFVFVGIAIAAVLGIGLIASGALKGVDPAAASASLAPVATTVAAPPPAADPPPQATTDNRLSDDQKAALTKFDDKTKSDQAKKAQDRAAKAVKYSSGKQRHTKEKDVFVKGGNKYDPLNASL